MYYVTNLITSYFYPKVEKNDEYCGKILNIQRCFISFVEKPTQDFSYADEYPSNIEVGSYVKILYTKMIADILLLKNSFNTYQTFYL